MSPLPRVSTTPEPTRFDVLVVGTANVCRSPAAERLLRARFRDTPGVVVTSAGTFAALDEPVPGPLAEILQAAGASVEGHTPRRLDPDAVATADLVLTMTREDRAEVVGLVPAALRRTFTLRELARVARAVGPEGLPDGEGVERLRALVAAAGPQRGATAPTDPADDDIADPFGGDRRAYAESVELVAAAVDDVVRTVRPAAVGATVPPPTLHARPARRRNRARDAVLVGVATLVVLVVALTVGTVVALDQLDRRIERFPDPFAALPSRPPVVEPQDGGATGRRPVTVLVLGSARDAADGPGVWADAAAVTDVVMLAHVSADRSSAHVVTLPPDLAVTAPDGAPGTLRSAFALGGPPAAVQTVEALTDVRVDHVALIDATTFARVTEALGGVTVDVAAPVTAVGGDVVPAGRQRLSGQQALTWMQGADAGRGEPPTGRADRAQAWLGAILDRLDDDDVRGNPASWPQLLGVVSGSVTVDEGFDRSTMVGLLTSLRHLRPGDVDVVTAPTTTTGEDEPVLVPDAAPFAALMDALRTDTLPEHLAAAAAAG